MQLVKKGAERMATVNLSQASEITGIISSTIKSHIKKGYLDAEQAAADCNYKIDLDSLRAYAIEAWNSKKVLMYNPILFFDERAKIVINSKRYYGRR